MRRLPVLLGTVVLAFTALPAAGVTQPNELTIIFEIEADHSNAAMDAMRMELASAMAPTGMVLRFMRLSDVRPADRFVEIVVVRFRGRCHIDGPPVHGRWTGTLAFTHASDGDILPFVDVSCDRVRHVIFDYVLAGHAQAERLLGRAWGRVLAHELYHVLANTAKHGDGGIAQARLSARDLVAETFAFDKDDLEKIRVPGTTRPAGKPLQARAD